MYDLLIIGGGPAAWSCAMTARSRSLSALVVTTGMKESGLSKADRIVNYPGVPDISGQELLAAFRQQALDMGVEEKVANARQVMAMGDSFMVLAANDILESRALVLALGASRPKMLPGEEELLGSGVSWCGTCDGVFYRGKEVAVISAWDGGVEEAEFLSGLCSHVDYYVLRAHDHVLPKAVTEISGRPQSLRREDGKICLVTDAGEKAYDGVFIFRPSVAPTQLLPELATENGFIQVDRRMQTNLPLVYACGDCTGRPLQIAKATGEGNVAAISAAEDLQKKSRESAQ